jgi:hypothetical protein
MSNKPSPRVCAGCRKPLSVYAIYGAYWHRRCFQKAPVEQREAARAVSAAERGLQTKPQGTKPVPLKNRNKFNVAAHLSEPLETLAALQELDRAFGRALHKTEPKSVAQLLLQAERQTVRDAISFLEVAIDEHEEDTGSSD